MNFWTFKFCFRNSGCVSASGSTTPNWMRNLNRNVRSNLAVHYPAKAVAFNFEYLTSVLVLVLYECDTDTFRLMIVPPLKCLYIFVGVERGQHHLQWRPERESESDGQPVDGDTSCLFFFSFFGIYLKIVVCLLPPSFFLHWNSLLWKWKLSQMWKHKKIIFRIE